MSRAQALWRSLAYNFRAGGTKQLLSKTVWKARRWSHSDTSWLVYRAGANTWLNPPPAELIRRPLDFAALREYQYFKALLLPELIHGRLQSGAVCHGFFQDSQLVNIAWTTMGYLELEAGAVITETGVAGIFDCYTIPAFRSRGFYTKSLVNLAHIFREEETTAVLIAVEPDNPASIKGIERAGFEPLYQFNRMRRWGNDTFTRQAFELRYATNRPDHVPTSAGGPVVSPQ